MDYVFLYINIIWIMLYLVVKTNHYFYINIAQSVQFCKHLSGRSKKPQNKQAGKAFRLSGLFAYTLFLFWDTTHQPFKAYLR